MAGVARLEVARGFRAAPDRVLSETAAEADVVLSAAQWAEEDGAMTNLEGRVLRRRRVRPPPHGVIDALTLLALPAGRLRPRPPAFR